MKKIIALVLAAAVFAVLLPVAYAACGGGGRYGGSQRAGYSGYRSNEIGYCSYENCDIAGYHEHDGEYCFGAEENDGQGCGGGNSSYSRGGRRGHCR